MDNRIKLSEANCEYFINEEKKTVSCKMFYRLKVDSDICESLAGLLDEFPTYLQYVTATTHLSKGDIFDVKKGMQVARAKAETMAYKNMRQIIKNLSSKLSRMLVVTTDFEKKADETINHNKRYIETF